MPSFLCYGRVMVRARIMPQARRVEKDRLKERTRRACAAFTEGMDKPQLEKRLEDVRGKLKASTDRNGRPKQGLGERAAACKEEIARLEGLIAD